MAGTTSDCTSARPTAGISSGGSPAGTGPTRATPSAARSHAHAAAMPRTTTISADGQVGATRRITTRMHHGAEAHRHGGRVRGGQVREVAPHLPQRVAIGRGDAGELADLADDQHDRHARDVPDEDRLGQVVGHPADLGDPRDQEHDARHDRQHRDEQDPLGRVTAGQGCHGRTGDEGDGALGAHDRARSGGEERIDQHRGDQRVEAGRHRDPCHLGVGHGRGQGQRRDGEAGEGVDPQAAPEYPRTCESSGTSRLGPRVRDGAGRTPAGRGTRRQRHQVEVLRRVARPPAVSGGVWPGSGRLADTGSPICATSFLAHVWIRVSK